MRKLIICNIPMKAKWATVYKSQDASLPSSDKAVIFPINAFLEKTLQPDDDVKVLLLVKEGSSGTSESIVDSFKEEIASANAKANAKIDFDVINTGFSQDKAVHEGLLSDIIDRIEVGDNIICDVTYGPKDMPIIIFTACNFAENHLECTIDNIIYGQAEFDDNNKPINTKLCDMSPLYYLNAVTNTMKLEDPQKAKALFKKLLSM